MTQKTININYLKKKNNRVHLVSIKKVLVIADWWLSDCSVVLLCRLCMFGFCVLLLRVAVCFLLCLCYITSTLWLVWQLNFCNHFYHFCFVYSIPDHVWHTKSKFVFIFISLFYFRVCLWTLVIANVKCILICWLSDL